MKTTVGVLDYAMGNLRSVEKAFDAAGARAFVSEEPRRLEKADLLVVPGVGAFDAAARVLRRRGVDRFLKEWIGGGRPYFGICLGLQLLFESSEEAPGVKGLGVLPGRVVKFRPARKSTKVPHMGWNRAVARPGGVGRDWFRPAHYYFVHSYYPVPADRRDVWTRTVHEKPFCSAVARDRVSATQFHPEKSGAAGLAFLRGLLASQRLTRGG